MKEGHRFVDKLLSILTNGDLDFSTFRGVLITRTNDSQKISRRGNGDVINAGFAHEVIDVETVGGNIRPVLYKKCIVVILGKQVFLAFNEYNTFQLRYNGRELLVIL